MENAVKKAIEGGYGYRNYLWNGSTEKYRQIPFREREEIFIDPEFWKCLGKAEGWTGRTGKYGINLDMMVATKENTLEYWVYNWHRFIDHLVEGKDPESFFESLLSKK